jgi:hypothetical protein
MLLVQIAGGLFGFGVAYAIHRIVELPYERSTAEARVKYLAEMAELEKQRNASRKRANLGAIK